MSNVDIKETTTYKRVEAIASKKSSIFGVSNRVLVPLMIPTIFLTINISFLYGFAYLLFLIVEIVLRYGLQLTLTEMFTIVWRAIFSSEIKSVKN